MVGKQLGHYEIVSRLGKGGMGEVWLAEDTKLRRQVALKLLPAETAQAAERLVRFRREAQAVAALNHPNIVTIYSVEESEGIHFLTMERVDGKTLTALIPTDGMELARLFEVALPLTDALATAHRQGIVHRDLKPDNVMVTAEGRVKVLDFGLAKLAEAAGNDRTVIATSMTQEGQIMGTASYMSPEQAEGKPVDARSDVFSLGIVLYQMATGLLPFRGDTAISSISSILKDAPPKLSDVKRHLPRELGRIVDRCLAKDPERRYPTAAEVHDELDQLHGTSGSSSGAVVAGVSAPGARRNWPRIAAVAALLLVAVAAGAWMWPGLRATLSSRGESSTPVETVKSIAVLPFVNMSPDPDNEYFSDGMTEELINALARVKGVRVPARTTVFSLKGLKLDVQEVGEKLGVDGVVEGSVRRADDRLRISAKLIDVADGFPLWSRSYDREMSDIFAVQEEIATEIVRGLQIVLAPEDRLAIASTGTSNPQAYDYYLRGRGFVDADSSTTDLNLALEMFSRAIEADRDYALAQAAVAEVSVNLYRLTGRQLTLLEQADRASRNALELDPEMAMGHVARALFLQTAGRVEEAERAYSTAVKLDPELFEAINFYAALCFQQGQFEKAADLYEVASELRPEDTEPWMMLTMAYQRLGRDADVDANRRRLLATVDRNLDLDPGAVHSMLLKAGILVDLGQAEAAFELVERALALAPADDSLVHYNAACVYAMGNAIDRGIEALQTSVRAGYRMKEWIETDPDLDSLRGDPRFEALLRELD